MASGSNAIRVGILGASGYTGAELLRLLSAHPQVEVRLLTANAKAGKTVAEVFPHLGGRDWPPLIRIEEADWSGIDFVFCALPHGTTQEIIAALPAHLKVVDLSADFRLHDPATYARWYGHEHRAPALQSQAVYGLTELARAAVCKSRLVANPGCYPTPAQLALIPLVENGSIDAGDIVIDAKSGVSGAGREAKEANLFAEVGEGVHPYSVGKHRHVAEIEQGLSQAAGRTVVVSFTPHLMPMNRGIEETIYVRLVNGANAADLRETLARRYADEPFIRVVAPGVVPHTRHVRGSNHVLIATFADRVPGRAIIVSVEDNLVKGASGQAIQNMNVMMNVPETTALEQQPLFP
jgi:N-acetyl-gamma-glutamyl-phosphate reductase